MRLEITTNNVPRVVTYAYELSEDERREFDYLDWEAIEKGEDSASFFRYKGQLYDLGEFSYSGTMFPEWDGYQSDTFFSGTLVRYDAEDADYVVVGRYYS